MTDNDKDKRPAPPPPQAPHRAPTAPPMQQQPQRADRGARAADDPRPEPRQGEAPSTLTADQVVTPPAGPPHVGGTQVAVIAGPYRGQMLIMPEAEAQQAIDDHWAAVPPAGSFDANNPPEHSHELTDEERAYAVEAANAWAAKVNAPPEPPPEEGVTGRRHPGSDDKALQSEGRAGYETRGKPGARE